MKTPFSISLVLIAAVHPVLSQTALWGLTTGGGAYGQGTLYSVNPGGAGHFIQHDFKMPAGYSPQGDLLLASDGNLYGTCFDGGIYASCTIFTLNLTTGKYHDVYDFDIIHGDFPRSGLIEGPGAMLYGVTTAGGDEGVLYSFDLATQSYQDLLWFHDSTGSVPWGSPAYDNGLLYGLTTYGGPGYQGVLYSYDLSNGTYVHEVDFNGANGAYPDGSLVMHADGNFYGLAKLGGTMAGAVGTLFRFNPLTKAFQVLLEFHDTLGIAPRGTLYATGNGLLYGTAGQGGLNNAGVLFSFDPGTSQYTVLHHFAGTDGALPNGSLFLSGTKLVGTTHQGGSIWTGVMFSYDLSTGIFTKLMDFTGPNGANPAGGFIDAPVPLSVSTVNPQEMGLYPNPASDAVTLLTGSMVRDAFVEIRDLAGRTVLRCDASGPAMRLDVTGLKQGMYTITLLAEGRRACSRLVKR